MAGDIVTDWRRFESGLWDTVPGDIYKASSIVQLSAAHNEPKKVSIISKVFEHEGGIWTCGGYEWGNWRSVAIAFRLKPTATDTEGYRVEYSYEGFLVRWRGVLYILGPRTVFVASVMNEDEVRDLLRRMYAHGGSYAHGVAYKQMIAKFMESDNDELRIRQIPGQQLAVVMGAYLKEIEWDQTITTREEMLEWLRGNRGKPKQEQMTLL
jgi:hypothetical protein